MSVCEVTLPQPVLFVLWQLLRHNFEGYIVGGALRDILMDRETNDWDFTTNATPEEIQRLFKGAFYDNQFGTVGVPLSALYQQMQQERWEVEETDGHVIEITTFRTEQGYSDRRRPDKVSWGSNIREDLERRDFTINAIAATVESETLNNLLFTLKRENELRVELNLIDPYEGQVDLEKRLIKAVRNPHERFEEDALRMMRGIRFGAQLGFTIETETLAAINQHAHLIKEIAWERIRDELLKTLASPYPADGMTLLTTSGLTEYIVPELLPMRGVKQGGHHIYDVWTHSLEALKACPSTDPIVRLATLLHDIGKPKTYREQGPRGVTFYGHEVVGARLARDIGRRLRLPAKDVDRLFILVRWHMFVYSPEMTDAAIRRLIRRVGIDNINDMMLLRVGDRKGGGSKATSWRLQELQERIGEQLYEPLNLKDMVVNGQDVMETLGIPPGPSVGKILNELFEEVLDDSSKNSREYLLNRMKELA